MALGTMSNLLKTAVFIDALTRSVFLPFGPLLVFNIMKKKDANVSWGEASVVWGQVCSLYILGRMVGHVIWHKGKHLFGSTLPVLLSSVMTIAALHVVLAVAQNTQTLYFVRLLSGSFGVLMCNFARHQHEENEKSGSNEQNRMPISQSVMRCLGFILGPLLGGLFWNDTAPRPLVDIILASPAALSCVLTAAVVLSVVLVKGFFWYLDKGRDGAPHEAVELLSTLEEALESGVHVQADMEISDRYLTVCKGNMVKAQEMWKRTLAWREENHVAQVLYEPQPHFFTIKECYPHIFHGKTRKGELVCYEKPGCFNAHGLINGGVSPAELGRHYMYINECLYSRMLPRDEDRIMTVLDVGEITRKLLNPAAVSFLKVTAEIMQSHYPERVARICVVNCPFWLPAAWKSVAPMLATATVEKISFSSSSQSLTELQKWLDDDQIPPEYGGAGAKLGSSPEEQYMLDLVAYLNGDRDEDAADGDGDEEGAAAGEAKEGGGGGERGRGGGGGGLGARRGQHRRSHSASNLAILPSDLQGPATGGGPGAPDTLRRATSDEGGGEGSSAPRGPPPPPPHPPVLPAAAPAPGKVKVGYRGRASSTPSPGNARLGGGGGGARARSRSGRRPSTSSRGSAAGGTVPPPPPARPAPPPPRAGGGGGSVGSRLLSFFRRVPQAHLGSENRFVFDAALGEWVEEGLGSGGGGGGAVAAEGARGAAGGGAGSAGASPTALGGGEAHRRVGRSGSDRGLGLRAAPAPAPAPADLDEHGLILAIQAAQVAKAGGGGGGGSVYAESASARTEDGLRPARGGLPLYGGQAYGRGLPRGHPMPALDRSGEVLRGGHYSKTLMAVVALVYGFWCGCQTAMEAILPAWLLTLPAQGGLGYGVPAVGASWSAGGAAVLALLVVVLPHKLVQTPLRAPLRAIRLGTLLQTLVMLLLPHVRHLSRDSTPDDAVAVWAVVVLAISGVALASASARSGASMLLTLALKASAAGRPGAAAAAGRRARLWAGAVSYGGEGLGPVVGAGLFAWASARGGGGAGGGGGGGGFPLDGTLPFTLLALLSFGMYLLTLGVHLNVITDFGVSDELQHGLSYDLDDDPGLRRGGRRCCGGAGSLCTVPFSDVSNLINDTRGRRAHYGLKDQ